MYNVSDAYKVAMKRPVQQGRVRGTLQSGLSLYDFDENNIGKGTFSLKSQCSGNDNVEIGTVYAAELSMTLIGMDIERYSLQKSVLTPRHELRTDNGYEPIPLGVFTVKEANWTMSGVEIKAYDNMVKLDKSCSIKTMQGSIYTFLSMAAYACQVELAQSEEYIQSLPNGNIELTVFVDNDIETWRDLVAWCAQATGTFAVMNREGRLELRTYGTDPVDEINYDRRITGSKFSDFETRYTGMSIVNISEKSTTYYNVLPDDGLTYNLGSNPLLQTGFEDVLEQQRRAVLDALTVIEYVPFEVSMICPPAYDLGDIVVFKNGIADGDKISCITQYDWKYGNDYSIKGVGQNPELASARSKTDKNLTGIMKSGEENKIQYYSFTNASDIKIEDGETKTIINIRFQCTQPTTAIFHAEVLLQAETTVDDIIRERRADLVVILIDSLIVLLHAIPLVDYDYRCLSCLVCDTRDLLVLLGYSLARVDHYKANVSSLYSHMRAKHAVFFYLIVDLCASSDTCGIDKGELSVLVLYMRIHRVSRCSRDIRNYKSLRAYELIDYRGLARVRLADNGNLDAVVILIVIIPISDRVNDRVEYIARAASVHG